MYTCARPYSCLLSKLKQRERNLIWKSERRRQGLSSLEHSRIAERFARVEFPSRLSRGR